MTYSIQTLENDLEGIIHGTTLNKITNRYGLYNRAAGEVLLDVDMQEHKRLVTLSQVFNSIYNYSAPSDLKGNRIIDLRPQANRQGEVWPQRFNQWFDKKKWLKNQNQFTIQMNTGVKSLRIDAPFLTAPIVVAQTNSTTGWTAGGTASAITLDTLYMADGAGDLTFNLTAGTGYIESSTLPVIDLTGHQSIAQEFFWAYFPTVPTSVSLRWGSSTTAYYEGTATTQADGTAFQQGWNNITIPWISATVTGSPTITAYDTVRFTVVAPIAMTGVKFCSMKSILGQYLEAEYYSKYFFRDSTTNAFQETVPDTLADTSTLLLNVDTESYGVYVAKLTQLIFQQLQGDSAKNEADQYEKKYLRLLARYKNLYPSEVQFSQESYYEPTRASYDGFVPRLWS